MAKHGLVVAVVMGVILVLVAGCGQEVSIEPQEIDPSLDDCPICRMSIIDQRFAGQVIDQLGYVESFDDIGCLVLYLKRVQAQGAEQNILAIYVKDFATTQWIRAEEAHYVQGRIDTPMSFGIVAFSTREGAAEMAAKIGGQIISWEEVKAVEFDIGFFIEEERERLEQEWREQQGSEEEIER